MDFEVKYKAELERIKTSRELGTGEANIFAIVKSKKQPFNVLDEYSD